MKGEVAKRTEEYEQVDQQLGIVVERNKKLCEEIAGL